MAETKEMAANEFRLVLDLTKQQWRQSHRAYQSGLTDDLDCRSRHWQMLDRCEKIYRWLLDGVLSGKENSISLNDLCEEMVIIHHYRKRLLTQWLAPALQKALS